MTLSALHRTLLCTAIVATAVACHRQPPVIEVPDPEPDPDPDETGIKAGVFPNPFTEMFTIKVDSEGFTDLVVYDVYGNVMTSARFLKSYDVDASNWKSGVYIVHYGSPAHMGKVVKLTKL